MNACQNNAIRGTENTISGDHDVFGHDRNARGRDHDVLRHDRNVIGSDRDALRHDRGRAQARS